MLLRNMQIMASVVFYISVAYILKRFNQNTLEF